MKPTNTPETLDLHTYKISFTARLKGAIGKFYKYTETVKATSEERAILELYFKYDHIHLPKVTLIK